jgi:hypothetical protein
LPPAPQHKGQVCTPRQVRAGVPAVLDAITYRALLGEAADAPLRAQTPAGLALALSMVQRPSRLLGAPEDGVDEADEAAEGPGVAGVSGITLIRPGRRARHARGKDGHGLSTLLRPV